MKTYNCNYVKDIEGEYLDVVLKNLTKEDEVSIKVLAEDTPAFMLPFSSFRHDDEYRLHYTTSAHVALTYRLEDFFSTREDYINLGLQIVAPFSKVIDWMTDYHSLVVSPDYVFQNKKTGKIYYVVAPCQEYKSTDEEIIEFLKVVLTAPRTDDSAAPFQNTIFRYFNEDNVNFEELYQLFAEEGAKLEGTPTVNKAVAPRVTEAPRPVGVNTAMPAQPVTAPAKQAETPVRTPSSNHIFADAIKPVTGPSFLNTNPMDARKENKGGSFADKQAEKERKEAEKKAEKERKEAEKQAEKERKAQEKKEKGGGLFAGFGKKAEKAVEAPANPEPASTPAASEGFDPFSEEEVQKNIEDHSDETVYARDALGGLTIGNRLRLVDSPLPGAPIMVDLNFEKQHIIIGRLTNNGPGCDIRFPDSFQSIGRQHAWIEKDEAGHFMLVDLDSANGTMLNGHQLIPNQKYSLRDGDEVVFSKIQPVKYKVEIKE